MRERFRFLGRLMYWLVLIWFAVALAGFQAALEIPFIMRAFVTGGFLALVFRLGEEYAERRRNRTK